MKKTDIALILLIVGLMAFCYALGRVEAFSKMEKQAISKGFGTYNTNGVFKWTK
jgi:hypothetical protein